MEGHVQHAPEVHHLVPTQDLDCGGPGQGRGELRAGELGRWQQHLGLRAKHTSAWRRPCLRAEHKGVQSARGLPGTMRGLVIKSAYTRPWKTCTVPSSEEEAKSGYERWKAAPRMA